MDLSNKKRKRLGEDSKRSKKSSTSALDDRSPSNTTTQHTPHSIKVSAVVKPQFSPPVIATSPGIIVPETVRFRSYCKPDRRKKVTHGPPKDLLLHSTSHTTMDYTAVEDRTKTLLKHYIGVFDPASGDLQIVEARKMTVHGSVRARRAADEAMVERSVRENMTNLKNNLGEVFGTKKAKKAIQSLAENAILPTKGVNGEPREMDDAELALMDEIKVTTANMATREELQANADLARPVPKGHYDAGEIQDVYIPEEIIGAEILNAIPVREWQESAEKQQAIQVSSRFVANRINRVAANEHAIKRLRILRYLHFLLIFYATTTTGKRGSRRIEKRDRLREFMHPAPEIVIENIRRKFSDQGDMRKTHVDLLITHCCVFAAIIDHFEVNTLDIRDDLKLEQKEINQYFHEIGARTKQSKSGDKTNHIAQLLLPLQFPKIRHARR